MRDKPRNTRTFHTVGETSQEGDNKLCTSKRDEERGTASFLFNNRTKLELWHLVDSVAFCGMERVFKGEGNIEREGGRRMDTGCLVRSVKQWWTVGDGKSIKNPSKKETKKKKLAQKRRESEREIKSGVCRNRLETFVDPTVVDVHIYLSLRTHNWATKNWTENWAFWCFPYSTFPYFLIPMADLVFWYDESINLFFSLCFLLSFFVLLVSGRKRKGRQWEKGLMNIASRWIQQKKFFLLLLSPPSL